MFMREVSYQMPGARRAELPARLEYRPEIQVHDIVLANRPIGWIGVIAQQSVWTTADHSLVPMTAHAKALAGERMDLRAQLALEHRGPYESPRYHFGE